MTARFVSESTPCRSANIISKPPGVTLIIRMPVDCVSHEAALTVKRLCRQTDRPFVPLRSAGLSSLLTALARSAFGKI
jgi:hypothetical protein